MAQEDPTLYNQITVKNIDSEDFVFKHEREMYMIGAGEVRVFPKFMVRPMLKHLIDKILIKRDPEGKLLRVQQLRDQLASQIILKEEAYERPRTPTDREIVDNMNKQPELDRILEKNKAALRQEESTLIPQPPVVPMNGIVPPTVTPVKPKRAGKVKADDVVVTKSSPVVQPVASQPEKFDQIEQEQAVAANKDVKVPTRESMLEYAKNVLKMDINETKTKKAFDSMSDKQLFVELGLDKEEDLAELGFK